MLIFVIVQEKRSGLFMQCVVVVRGIQKLCPSPSPSCGWQASGNMTSLGTGGLHYVFVCHCINNGNE